MFKVAFLNKWKLRKFFIMARVPYMVSSNTGFGQYLCYQLEFL